MCRFSFFMMSMAHFSMRNSVTISLIYILTACIKVSNSLAFLTKMSTMFIWWLIVSGDLVMFYQLVHFLSIWLSGIFAIINSNGDSAFPWKIPLRIFTSVKLLPSAVNCTLQFSMLFSINFMTSYILYIMRQSIIKLCGTIFYGFL